MRKRNYFFQWKSLVCLLMILFTSILVKYPAQGQYVRTNGTSIVDGNGNDIFFTGMNLGNWLLWEGYLMMGDFNYRTHTQFFNGVKTAFGGDLNKAIEFEHQWRLNYVTNEAIRELKALGFNSVRVPFHFNLFWDYNSNAPSDRGFQYLDALIQHCRTHGVYIMLDMHAAPGYQNPGDHSDNNNSNASQPRGSVQFWDGNNVNIASQVWRHIANRYKNEPMIWGYDLINEPVPQPGREFELLKSMKTMRDAIRQVDNNHVIIAEGSWWGSDMEKLDWTNGQVQSVSGVNSRWDNNLVYQTHHYSSDVSALNGRKDLCNRLNVPFILGEYGESDDANLRSMTNWCISNNVDYFPWSFKKMSHDKCLWTINPNGPYNSLKSAINANSAGPSSLYNDMISFCQNNIANGKPGLTWHQGFYDAVKNNSTPPPPPPASGVTGLGGTWILRNRVSGMVMDVANGNPANGTNILQWNNTGAGNQQFRLTEVSTGVYSIINVQTSKAVDIAGVSTANGANVHIWDYLGGNNQKFKAESAGGGYYKFRALHSNKIIEVGNASLAANANINQWDDNGQACGQWQLLTVGTPPPAFTLRIQAESNFQNFGIQTENTTDTGGGQNVGWIDAGDWMGFAVNIPTAGNYRVEYRVASPSGGGALRLEQFGGGTVFGTMTNLPNTTGWQNWQTVSHNVSLNAGQQNLAIAVTAGAWNFNWFQITRLTGARMGEELNDMTDETVELYPNPASSQLTIKGITSDYSQLMIYGMDGRQHMAQKLSQLGELNLNVSGFEKGIYFVKLVRTNGSHRTIKFIKN